jgi:hypothetical protein
MTGWSVFAQAPEAVGLVVKGLAVLGGAVLGGLLTGLLVQLLVKALTAQKLPRYLLQAFRLIGALLAGWLVALFVFGGGGSGLGGLGGWGFGPNQQKDSSAKKDAPSKEGSDSAKDKSRDKGLGPASESVLRVEVLTNPAVEKVLGKEGVERRRFYRIEGAEANDLLTLDEMKKKIRERLAKQPPLQRLDIVTGLDNPDKNAGLVVDLRQWAEDQKLKVEFPPR